MEGFVIRVTAYHGEPQQLCTVYVRSGISHDTPVANDSIVNDPGNEIIVDLNYPTKTSDYTLDALLADFQDEYGCKVNYEEPVNKDGLKTFEFDVFEPSWPEKEETEDVIEDLSRRLVDWVQGYPTGR